MNELLKQNLQAAQDALGMSYTVTRTIDGDGLLAVIKVDPSDSSNLAYLIGYNSNPNHITFTLELGGGVYDNVDVVTHEGVVPAGKAVDNILRSLLNAKQEATQFNKAFIEDMMVYFIN